MRGCCVNHCFEFSLEDDFIRCSMILILKVLNALFPNEDGVSGKNC
jgi:hypothetical protein